MDPTIDYDIAEINFRPKYKTRKSYARDSHGFELENNYFQDPSSSEEESSSSSDEGSFTLSLEKGTKQPQQPRLSKQHDMVAMLPSGTKSNKSSRHSPSPLKSYNHSPVKITSNPKKRLTFEIDSNEENRKNPKDESISESEEDGLTAAEEILPGSYSASGLDPSRHSSVTKKKVVKSFDLGEFSDSSSDTDEDTAAIKKSMFVRQVGKDTLMCLPKLSEYIKPRQKNVVPKKKPVRTQRQQNGKRKESTLSDVNIPAKRKKNVHMVKRQVAREESAVDDSTATEEEENTKVTRTERNPKLAKKRTSTHRYARQSPVSPVSDCSQKSFAVLQNTTSKIIDSIYGNDEQNLEEDVGAEIEQSVQQRTSRPSISFTSKGEEIRQTRSGKNKIKQNVEPCVPDPRRTDVTLRHSRKRRLITEAENEEHSRTVSHDHKQQRRSQRLLASDGEISNSAPVKVMEKQQKKKKEMEKEVKHDDHKRQGRLLSFEAEKSNSSTVKNNKEKQQHNNKKKEEHDLKQQKVSEGEMSDGPTVKVMEKQQKQKKKEDVPAKQKPPREVEGKNKGQILHKDKRKDASRDKKRRKLIDESKSLYQQEQGYVHIPVTKASLETTDGTLRRSSRTRVPAINYLLGEQLIYEASASGGMVVKEIIRPSLSTTQQQIKPPKKRPKRPKQSSTDILQESKSSQSNSKAPPAKQKHRKLDTKQQHAEEDHDLEVVNEDDTKKNVTLLPVSPRKKESLGIALLKSMFETETSLATELVQIVNEDGTKRPSVEVVKPLQSLRLSNASGSMVTPDDPFIMAILSRQKNTNFGVAILNKMGDKGEQSTENGSVCFFLISGEIIVKIGDLELHPPVWSRIYVPEGISYTLKNLQHTPAVLAYVVIKSNKDDEGS